MFLFGYFLRIKDKVLIIKNKMPPFAKLITSHIAYSVFSIWKSAFYCKFELYEGKPSIKQLFQ